MGRLPNRPPKAGVLSLTTAFAEAGAADGVRVNAICPGGVDTPILKWASQPVPDDRSGLGLLDPIDVARLVLHFLTHPDITGQIVAANWASTAAPATTSWTWRSRSASWWWGSGPVAVPVKARTSRP